ncbi:MAG TPA: dTMP kinase, partial [Actinomycetota bacterium]|nr:dTMP kinase [Actinomycetota bacterium]
WVGFLAVASLVAQVAGGAGGAAFAISGLMLARTLPAVLFGPIAGALIDRLDRKQIMIVADIARGALYATMVVIGQLWAIYALSFVIESLSLMWGPARDASLPNLVPRRQLANANSIALASTYGTLPLGGIVFTLLVGLNTLLSHAIPVLQGRDYAVPLFLDAATFLFSAAMISRVPILPSRGASTGRLDFSRIWRDVVDGIRFLREDSIASAMTAGIVVAFSAVGAVLALGPIFVVQTLDAGNAGWGFIVTSFGIGIGLGMVSANHVARLIERVSIFPWSLVVAAGTLFVLATMPNLGFAAVVTVWLGAFCGLAWVTGYTLLQENVTDEYRGRTFAALTILSRMGLFLSLALFPTLAGAYGTLGAGSGNGIRLALASAGIAVALAGLNTRRLLKRYRLSRPEPLGLVPKLKRPPATGFFIAFEGVEGSGKGTQIAMAEEFLRREGYDVLVTREPGGTEVGERVRELLLDPNTGNLDARAEALLFAASRAQTVHSVIRPALAEGKVVICDRYVDSSLAYQGWGRGLGEQDVLTLNVWGTQGLFPDLVILLHLEPERGLLRSTEAPDRMELEGQDFHAKVANAYLKIAEEHPERFVVVEADKPPALVFDGVRAAIDRALTDREDGRATGSPGTASASPSSASNPPAAPDDERRTDSAID